MPKQKLLVIDNDPDFVTGILKVLESDYDMSSALSRETGLKKANHENPDAVVLGYLEPQGASFDFHQELRLIPAKKHIPILIVDVSREKHTRKGWRRWEGLRMDVDGYLARPVDPRELRTQIARILDKNSMKQIEWKEFLEQSERQLKQDADHWWLNGNRSVSAEKEEFVS